MIICQDIVNMKYYYNSRYPTELAETDCRCDRGIGMPMWAGCEAITYPVRILRKTAECTENGYAKYEEKFQLLKAGCTMINDYEGVAQ